MSKTKEVKNVVGGFKKFINRGNILDLATGIIIGAAFTAVVNSLVNDVIMPLISRLINFDLRSAKAVLRPEIVEIIDGEEVVTQTAITLNYGAFIQTVINFIIIAIAIYTIVTTIRIIKNSYIKNQIKYIKNLKRKHPEFFDEEDELGTILYEKMKREHPEYFQTEIAKEIEAKQALAQEEKTPQEVNNELLTRLNENLEKLYSLKVIDKVDNETNEK